MKMVLATILINLQLNLFNHYYEQRFTHLSIKQNKEDNTNSPTYACSTCDWGNTYLQHLLVIWITDWWLEYV